MNAQSPRDLGRNPGSAPRSISLGRVFSLAPVPLQIGTTVTPLGALIGAVWLAVEPGSKNALMVLAAVPFPLLLAVVWLWRVRTVATRGVPALGEITRIKSPENLAFATSVEVRYSYEWEGTRHKGHTIVGDPATVEGYAGGDGIHLVIDPRKPSRSLPWLV